MSLPTSPIMSPSPTPDTTVLVLVSDTIVQVTVAPVPSNVSN